MEDLEARKLYQILRDREAAREGYIRIVDESGEAYIICLFVRSARGSAITRRLLCDELDDRLAPDQGPLTARFDA